MVTFVIDVVAFCRLHCFCIFLVFVRAVTGRAPRMVVAQPAPSGVIHISPLMIITTLTSKVPAIIYSPKVWRRMAMVSR